RPAGPAARARGRSRTRRRPAAPGPAGRHAGTGTWARARSAARAGRGSPRPTAAMDDDDSPRGATTRGFERESPTGTARTAPATARAGRRARRGLRARGRAAVRRSRARVQQQQGWCQPLGRAGRMESLDRWAGDDLDGLAAAQLELHGRALRHPREPGITRAVGPADLVAG